MRPGGGAALSIPMATTSLDHTLSIVSEASSLPVEMQRRIAEYGISRKKPAILVPLARREDLDEEISQQLLAYGDAKVTAERVRVLAGAGRIEEVANLLKKERRVTVTKGLAETPGLPAEIYRVILATKRQTALIALARNSGVDEDIREDAVVRALAHGFFNYPRNLQTAVVDLPNVAKRLLVSDVPVEVWRFALDNCSCSSEDRAHLAGILAEKIDTFQPVTPKRPGLLGGVSPENHGLWDYAAIVGTLAGRPLEKGAANRLADSLEELVDRAHKAQVTEPAVGRLAAFVGDLRAVEESDDFVVRVEAATNSNELRDALESARGSRLTLAEMHKILTSPWFGPEHWRYLQHNWHHMSALHGTLTDASPATIAYMRVRLGWFGGLDDMVSRGRDPKATLHGLIDLERSWNLGMAAEILSSRHLDEEHVKNMTLSMLAAGAGDATVDVIGELITKATASREAWDALIGIGAEFEGTISELLETSANL